MSRLILPDRGTFGTGPPVGLLGISSAGGDNERPRTRSDFVGLGVGILVAVRLGGLGGEVLLVKACFRGLGVGIRDPKPRFGGLGVLARRIKEANLA